MHELQTNTNSCTQHDQNSFIYIYLYILNVPPLENNFRMVKIRSNLDKVRSLNPYSKIMEFLRLPSCTLTHFFSCKGSVFGFLPCHELLATSFPSHVLTLVRAATKKKNIQKNCKGLNFFKVTQWMTMQSNFFFIFIFSSPPKT